MPIYEFRCQDCKKLFESLLTSSAPSARADISCPECDSKNIRKTISASSFRISSSRSAPMGKPLGGCAARGGFS